MKDRHHIIYKHLLRSREKKSKGEREKNHGEDVTPSNFIYCLVLHQEHVLGKYCNT